MRFRYLFILFFLVTPGSLFGKEVRDTLKTRTGDRIIIPYEYILSGEELTVRFKPALKRLGAENARRYKKLEELTVVLFDRKGAYEDAAFSGDLTPEAFMVPASLSYSMSREGYYLLHDSPSMSFRLKEGARDVDIAIPAYLAHHVKKGRYKLIARCGDLTIKVKAPSSRPSAQPAPAREAVATSTVEVEADNGDMTRVLDCIANINSRLPQEDRLPMSESLEGDVRLLREWKYTVTDPNLKDKVSETLDAYELKKRQLEDAEAARIRAEQRRAEEEQLRAQEEMKEQQEAEAARQQEEAEKNRKKNIWTIIGGVVLAAGAFVGNQALQNLRNKKNQLNMMEMQQTLQKNAEDAARQAENAAKRKVQGLARAEMNKVQNMAKSETKKVVDQARTMAKDMAGKGKGRVVSKNKNKKSVTI